MTHFLDLSHLQAPGNMRTVTLEAEKIKTWERISQPYTSIIHLYLQVIHCKSVALHINIGKLNPICMMKSNPTQENLKTLKLFYKINLGIELGKEKNETKGELLFINGSFYCWVNGYHG